MEHTLATRELEEVLPSDAEEILHHGHVAPRWSGAAWLDKTLEWIVGAAILAELVVILLNIMGRVITGGTIGAEDGRLSTMVGGPAAVVERLTPLFELYSSTVVWFGKTGAVYSALRALQFNGRLVRQDRCRVNR